MKVGDLVKYTPTHNIDHLLSKFGTVVGLVMPRIAGNDGDITKLLTPCGKIYWAVTKDCEVISESR